MLALVALLVQSLPLQTCTLSYVLSGTTCHDGGPAIAANGGAAGFDGCAPHSADGHDRACVCETPKASINRAPQPVCLTALGVDVCDVLLIEAAGKPEPVRHELAARVPFAVGRGLPLLI
jgi:hypothetical protein